jgi:3-phenylpropionate/trans-cinnamate dioxygenase ferredoxin reductase component
VKPWTILADSRRVVVIGAGLGGLRTVERLRSRGFTGKVVLLGAERHLPYDRPPLSKQVLRGEAGDPWLRSAEDFPALDATVRIGEPATGLSLDHQLVLTRDGQIPYDIVVIATGSVPRRIPGLDGTVLRTLDEAHALRAALRPGRRLGVVGAGLVGCEVAASARSMGVQVDLVDVLAGPVIRVVGPKVAPLVADLHADHGVVLHMGAAVLTSDRGTLALDSGMTLDVDIVLEAIGAVPDTEEPRRTYTRWATRRGGPDDVTSIGPMSACRLTGWPPPSWVRPDRPPMCRIGGATSTTSSCRG